MPTPSCIPVTETLALAVSRIHRCPTLAALRQTFLDVAPALVDADAYGLYLLDPRRQAEAVYALRADRGFLDAYEELRASDPCFRAVVDRRRFTHTREVIDEGEWVRHPLCRLMSRWGLRYSIEAPLIADGRLVGTLNIARRGREYFDAASLARARFLCDELGFVFDRLARDSRAGTAASRRERAPSTLSPRTRAVAVHAAEGLPNRAIAARLGISENTVRDHLRRAYTALDVHNRVQLSQRLRADGASRPPAAAG